MAKHSHLWYDSILDVQYQACALLSKCTITWHSGFEDQYAPADCITGTYLHYWSSG